MESHRACKSHVRVGPMPSNSRLTQNRLMTFFETLSFILLYYDNFFLTGLFLVCYRFWFFVFVNFMMVLFLLLFLWFCLFLKKIVWRFFLFQFIENRFFSLKMHPNQFFLPLILLTLHISLLAQSHSPSVFFSSNRYCQTGQNKIQ